MTLPVPTVASHPSTIRRRFAPGAAAFVLAMLVVLAAGCGPSKVEVARDRLAIPLASLADSGDVEALRMIADIEVLRADGMFSDSLANTLTAMPTTEFFALDDKGVRARAGRGVDIGTLLAYTSAEPMLLKEAAITPEQAAELRRMALDNITAAAEMAASYGARGADTTGAPPAP